MEILSLEIKNTFWEAIVVTAIFIIVMPLLFWLLYDTGKKIGKWAKYISIVMIINLICFSLYSFYYKFTNIENYEIIEAKINNWNTIMNDDSYIILSRDGNLVELRHNLEDKDDN